MLKLRSTEELVDASVAGDADAFGELVMRFERAAWLTAWHVLREHHAALDAMQNGFIVAYRNLPQLRVSIRFGGWLMRIVHREAIKVARGVRRNQSPVDINIPCKPSVFDEHDEVARAVASLPDHERLVVVLKYLDGHSIESIVQMTGRPVGTVTKQLSRAIARLKTILKDT